MMLINEDRQKHVEENCLVERMVRYRTIPYKPVKPSSASVFLNEIHI